MAAERKYQEFLKRMAVDFRAFKEYIEEIRSFRSFPWSKYKGQQDAAALAFHVKIPSGAILLKEEGPAGQQLTDEIEKIIIDFGTRNGYPVFYVLTEDEVPPSSYINGVKVCGKMHMFRLQEIAADFAGKNNGLLVRYDGPLPAFCRSHNCTEFGPKCDRCACTAMGSSMRRKLDV